MLVAGVEEMVAPDASTMNAARFVVMESNRSKTKRDFLNGQTIDGQSRGSVLMNGSLALENGYQLLTLENTAEEIKRSIEHSKTAVDVCWWIDQNSIIKNLRKWGKPSIMKIT